MRRGLGQGLRWLSHPIVVFILVQVVWLAITLIWVIWFVGSGYELARLAKTATATYLDDAVVVSVLVVGCVLLGLLLFGTVFLFVLQQRQRSLLKQQRIFISSVTHELRSPLASLQLSLETLQRRNLEPKLRTRIYTMALEETQRLTRLVHRVLLTSRLDQGILGSPPSSVWVRQLVERVIDNLAWADPALRLRVRIRCPASLRAWAPEEELSLILSNLVENAIKYSEPASPIVVRSSCEGHRLVVSVEDRGMGFRSGEARKLFRLFYRCEGTRPRAIPGTGLGLYIVATLVHHLGGQVTAHSAGAGRGATFTLVLPVQLPSEEDQHATDTAPC